MKRSEKVKIGYRGAIALGLLFLVSAPLFVSNWIVFVVTLGCAKGMVVLGVVLLLRGGLISLGHGLYYAAGAYAVAFALNRLNIRETYFLIPLSLLAGGGMAGLTGLLLRRYRGIFFAMLSLAFSMILYTVLFKFYNVTGGTDGMRIHLTKEGAFLFLYYLTLILTVGVIYLGRRLIASPLGYMMQAVRYNEIRVEYMGASVGMVIYVTYVFSGMLGGLGGGLVALNVGHVAPELAYWTACADFVFVAVLGGANHVLAPFLGSIVFEFVKNYAFKLSPNTWQMTLGGILLLIIFFLPQGLWSLTEAIERKVIRWELSSRP